jgi:hypothetical protein
MKIMIVGSIDTGFQEDRKVAVRNACKEIGKALAEKGVDLVVGSDRDTTVDKWVVYGAVEADKRISVYVYRPDRPEQSRSWENRTDDNLPFSDVKDTPQFKKIKFQYILGDGRWGATHLAGLRFADAALIVSGADGARESGHAAVVLQKPMLPIGCFGGSGAELWTKYSPAYRDVEFTNDEYVALSHNWGRDSPGLIISSLNKVLSKNPFRRFDNLVYWLCGLFISSLIVWAGAFYEGTQWDKIRILAIVLMGLCAALFGTVLRNFLELLAPIYQKKDRRIFIAEIFSGLILTFGFYLFFGAGSFVISASGATLSDAKDFTRVGFSVSIIGLAASLLLEKAIPEISRRLGGVLGGQDKNISL